MKTNTKLKFLLVVSTMSFSMSCFASDAPSVHDYCESIQAQKGDIHRPSQWSLLKDVFRLVFTPGKLVHLKKTEINIPEQLRVQANPLASQPTSDESPNIIFSISPPDELLQTEPIDEMRQRYDEINAEMAALRISLIYIVAASSTEDCISRVTETKFDIQYFTKLTDERSSLRIIEQIDDARAVDKIIGKTLRHLHLYWKVVHSTDLMEVHAALQNRNVKNLVIFSHGLTEGKLVDSRISEYPLGFFSDLSPSLKSLTIFACHGEEIAKTYHLSEFLAANPSEHSTRELIISQGTKIAGMDELVPVRSFHSFMKKVDQQLSHEQEEEAVGPLAIEPTQCEMSLDHFKVVKGSFGFLLNGHYIGSINKGNGDSTITLDFPCSYADRSKNILTIHGLSLVEVSTIESPLFKIRTQFSGREVSHSELIHYFRADHSYQGSKFEFEI